MTENEPGISSATAARLLGVSKATMATWRSRETGPPVYYAATKPIYFASEVRAWMESCSALMRQKREQRGTDGAQGGSKRRGRPKGGVRLVGGS